ncbi:hypothetical protein OH77DRAFT_1283810 [Trametes cingulata]|nr:hypothetical protein OH77DRAFT_1283810 [Trametes cingulata]
MLLWKTAHVINSKRPLQARKLQPEHCAGSSFMLPLPSSHPLRRYRPRAPPKHPHQLSDARRRTPAALTPVAQAGATHPGRGVFRHTKQTRTPPCAIRRRRSSRFLPITPSRRAEWQPSTAVAGSGIPPPCPNACCALRSTAIHHSSLIMILTVSAAVRSTSSTYSFYTCTLSRQLHLASRAAP